MIFTRDLGAPETPRLLPDRSWLCVEMAPDRGCVTHISADGRILRTVVRTGKPNGCLPDWQGNIWVAETFPTPALMRVTMAGGVEVVMERTDDGQPFLLPNDLCFAADGILYMTDSGIFMGDWVVDGDVRADWQEAPFDGRVYRIDLQRGFCTLLDDGLRFANGIAVGPDGHLYVNEMITGMIYRYLFDDGEPTGVREDFANVLTPDWSGGFRGPDGMAFDRAGKLYCTVFGQQDVTILDRAGTVTRRITTAGRRPTNVAFGPDDELRIYVTEYELGQIELFDVDEPGLPLYHG